MRNSIPRTLEVLLIVFLLAPAGLLFSTEQNPLPQPESNSSNWDDTQQATNLITNIQYLAARVTNEVGPLQVEGTELPWQAQSANLAEIRRHVNKMSDDLFQLSEMNRKLEPWQQKLLHLMTPKVHELVYQTRAAVKEMNDKQSSTSLALTQYPHNLNVIARQSNKIVASIGTFTQYHDAKTRLAHLQRHATRASS